MIKDDEDDKDDDVKPSVKSVSCVSHNAMATGVSPVPVQQLQSDQRVHYRESYNGYNTDTDGYMTLLQLYFILGVF